MKTLCLILVCGMLIVSGCTKVEPGYVGVKVNNYGGQKGVSDFPALTGMVWYNPFTSDVYKFPTFLQNVVWTKDCTEGSPEDDSITFNSIEGAVVNADIALSYSIVSEKVPAIFVEFRKDVQHITGVYMRSKVRDAFGRCGSKMPITGIFGDQKQALLDAVRDSLNNDLGPKGFQFDMVSFVGALRVDDKVTNSINATIEATQKAIEAENLVRQAEANARSQVAKAKGEADAITALAIAQAEANRIVASSLTPDLVHWQAVQKWSGTLPSVTGGAMPFINVDKNQ